MEAKFLSHPTTGRILLGLLVGERTAPHPGPLPSDGEREKTRWQQGRARPLTPALSPSDGEREKRGCAASRRGGTKVDRGTARDLPTQSDFMGTYVGRTRLG